MIPRWFLTTLVFALPILAIIFGVVLGASLLTSALGDAAGSYGLFWFAMVALIVLVIDALLLLALLGIRALDERRDDDGREI
jgi:hypothetical protein